MLRACFDRTDTMITRLCSGTKMCFKEVLAGLIHSKDICTKCLCERNVVKQLEEINPLIDERFNPRVFVHNKPQEYIVESPGC